MLPISPFPTRALAALNFVAQALLFPAAFTLNQLLDLQPNTAERRRRFRCLDVSRRAVVGSALAVLFLLATPLALVGLLLWLPAQATRREFAYSFSASAESVAPWDGRQRRDFTFVSANVCLLPSGLAKFSNLGQTVSRAKYLARCLAPDGATDRQPLLWERFPPAADFVCLQEVFDPVAEALLCRQLGLRYPHVLHGVGAGGLRAGGLKLFGSGLLVASRYPVMAASFYCYPNGAGEDALAAKGLLCIQVALGRVSGCRLLGYVSCTHLQAPERDTAIRSEQLRLALRWVQHFQETHSEQGDVVGFDVLCGDLNCDNCSWADGPTQQQALFRHYCDPGRLGLRREAPWAMGTLLDYLKIHDDPINSPERMRRTLSDPEGRRRFLAGPLLCSPKCHRNPDPKCHRDPNGDPKCHGDPDGDPEPTEFHGRRVDYILYREWGTELSTAVSALGFVTALAARSDHLPVALTLSVSPTSGGGPDPQVPPPAPRPPATPPNCDPKMPPMVPKWP